MDLNLVADGLEMVVAKAAIATFPWIGKNDKNAGDQAAVDAMRVAFNDVPIDGVIRVGEGEKDEAPMLYVGELVGSGTGISVDIAVDPVEGTALMADDLPNSITVAAATERGGMWDAGSAYYMDKIVLARSTHGKLDIRKGAAYNLTVISEVLDKPVEELCIYVLDKPRHIGLIREIESCGAKVSIHPEGDVVGSILALLPDTGIDALMGIGGAQEAVITAAAVKALGGEMQGKLQPQKEAEKNNLINEGVDLEQVLGVDDFIKTDWSVLAAAGVTDGAMLQGVTDSLTTQTLLIGPGNTLRKRYFT